MKKFFYLSGSLLVCFIFCSVIAKAKTVPVITTNLHDTTICIPSTAPILLTVQIQDTLSGLSGDTVVFGQDTAINSYKWQFSANAGVTWSNIPDTTTSTYSGGNTDTLHIKSVTGLNGYLYRLIVTAKSDSVYTATSNTSMLTLLSIPTVSGITGGDTAICPGTTTTFIDSTPGGTWTISNYNANVAADGSVTGITGGSTTIYYSVTNACGTERAAKTFTVRNAPFAGTITGNEPICKVGSVTLSDTVTGGTWSSTNIASATIDPSGVVTGFAEGIDTIKYTVVDSFSCISVTSAIVRVDTFVTAFPITGPATTCVGSSIELSNVNTHGEGTWSTNNSNAVVNAEGWVTGVSYGVDTITYLFSNACNSVSSSKTITTDTVLEHGVISGANTVCAGSYVTLSETVAGGIWLSSDPYIAIVDGSGNVTAMDQGGVTISYYFSNGCGPSMATYPVEVYRTAADITGADSVGVGQTINLSDTTIDGVWSNSNVAVATINSMGVVEGVATGTDTITYTVMNFCGTSSAAYTIYVGIPSSTGTITGPDSVCVGASISLADIAVAGGVWNSTNNHATVNTSGIVTGVSSGNDTIYYSVTSGFGTTKSAAPVYVNIPPVIDIDTLTAVSISQAYTLTATPAGGIWTTSNDSIAQILPGTNILIIISDTNKVNKDTVFYIATNNCGTRQSDFIINVPQYINPTGVNSITQNEALDIYPNPNQGEFTFNLQSPTTDQAIVIITNILGDKVGEMKIATNTKVDIKIDEPSGVYFLTVTTANTKYSAKINIVR